LQRELYLVEHHAMPAFCFWPIPAERIVTLLNEKRPGREFDRAVKAVPQRYTVQVLKRNLN
jgi:hypothetical protein